MCADIFGTDMEVDDAKHSSLLGGAALAMELLGVIGDVAEFTIEGSEVIHPNPEKTCIYAKKYERYKYWYEKTV